MHQKSSTFCISFAAYKLFLTKPLEKIQRDRSLIWVHNRPQCILFQHSDTFNWLKVSIQLRKPNTKLVHMTSIYWIEKYRTTEFWNITYNATLKRTKILFILPYLYLLTFSLVYCLLAHFETLKHLAWHHFFKCLA